MTFLTFRLRCSRRKISPIEWRRKWLLFGSKEKIGESLQLSIGGGKRKRGENNVFM